MLTSLSMSDVQTKTTVQKGGSKNELALQIKGIL